MGRCTSGWVCGCGGQGGGVTAASHEVVLVLCGCAGGMRDMYVYGCGGSGGGVGRVGCGGSGVIDVCV